MTHIDTSIRDGVLTLTINRPDKKNALTLAMYEDLTKGLAGAADDQSVRVVLLTGTGDSFTAGNDLEDFLKQPPTGEDAPSLRFLRSISTFRKPLVAAVNGRAIGIGTTMLLHCDLVYASTAAQFHLPFVNLALVPEAGSSLLLPNLAGFQRAAELLLLGEPFDATRAAEAGIVNEVLDPDQLGERATGIASALASRPPRALVETKALMKRQWSGPVAEAMQAEGEQFMHCLQSDEAREAMQAILEKRPPDFSRFS